jgi:hypothetical protein
MDTGFTRPKVADLIFRLYDRPVHPELFESVAERRVTVGGVSLTVRLTTTGHVLEWHRNDCHLVELTAASDQLLPLGGRMSHRFTGTSRGRFRPSNALRYEMSSHAETLPPDLFLHIHDELAADGRRRGVIAHFRPRHRFGLEPLGFVTVDSLPSGLAVASFHTFPDEFAVVKTQSLIEF